MSARSRAPQITPFPFPFPFPFPSPSVFALAISAALLANPSVGVAQQQQPAPLARALTGLSFREIGPAIMGGRVSDIAAVDATTFYVGFATGGLWRTTNNGMSWTPLFEDETTSSVGEVTLAPSNPNVIWIGTGEPQNRQSSPWGDGVFKSTDAGRTWQHMGLRETRHIARIAIHPTNPDIVYIAAVGHLFGPNEERGVFRTVDGGATWEKVLYRGEHVGAIDLVMDPGDPRTLFAALYQRQRTPWGYAGSGEGETGLYRTTDGGATWTRLTNGLPSGPIGRIGLDVYRRDGNIVYATVEADDEGGLYRSNDRGESWTRVSDRNPRPMYFSHVRIDPNDPEKLIMAGVSLSISEDGGRTWWEGDAAEGIHVDHHAIWIDPDNSDHVLLGSDGGIASSLDGGRTWRHHNNLAVGQFYAIGVDMRDPYFVCGGLQDNSSWCGPSDALSSYGIRNQDWYDVSGGDGFFNKIDPTNPDIVYTESQGGNMSRYDVRTGEAVRIRPEKRTTGDDSTEYRWNWSTPIHISHHDPATIYVGSNHLMRSRDRGVTWEEASPDLTRGIDRDTLPIMGARPTDATLSRNDGVSSYGTITTIGESPVDGQVVYAGTDDGSLQVTRDGGATWSNITARVPGLEHGMVVSAVEPSHHVAGRVYISFDGHFSDDYRPYVAVSEDYGQTWQPIVDGLPTWSVNVVREHPRTADLLFAGNEVGVYASFDRGRAWHRLTGGETTVDAGAPHQMGALPTVPVDDIVIHPRDNDLILGTHGRSIWILDDVSPLEHMVRGEVFADAAHLFPVAPATHFARQGGWPFWGDLYDAPSPVDGARIRYHLASDVAAAPAGTVTETGGSGTGLAGGGPAARADGAANATAPARARRDSATVRLVIADATGATVRTLEAPGRAGLHEVVWDLRMEPPYEPEPEPEPAGAGGGRGGGGGGGRGGFGGVPDGPRVLPGTYTIRLEGAGAPATTTVEVRGEPRVEIARADLESRQRVLMELQTLAVPVYQAGRALARADERVSAVRDLLRGNDAAAAVRAQADSLEDAIADARRDLGRANRAGRLQGAIEGATAPPTADQLWQIERTWADLPAVITRVNEIVSRRLPALTAQVYHDAVRPDPIPAVTMPPRG
jgi:photosystem II stability/assembly factor-like uncharacterized protein